MEPSQETYEQRIGYARASLWTPFWAVGMVARVQGCVPTGLLQATLRKLQTLHPPLASRVCVEEDGSAFMTTEGVGEFVLEVRPRTSATDWAGLFLEQERLPFAFGSGPVARFFLLRGEECSDLVAIVPHVVCDGFSTAHMMSDLVALLNEPGRPVAQPAPLPVAAWKSVVHSATDSLLLRGLVRVINRIWPRGHVVRDTQEYEELHRQYWSRQEHGLAVCELPAEETASLAARCKANGVSVTAALAAAFLLAQGNGHSAGHPARHKVAVPVSIRDRMVRSPGREIGIYASAIDVVLRTPDSISFWDLARQSHRQIRRALHNRPRVLRPLVVEGLDPAIADGLVAAMATNRYGGAYRLLTRLMRMRDQSHSLTVSNIGRIELPDLGTPYRLKGLVPLPPIGPGSRLMLNVLTLDGRMNLVLKYRCSEIGDAAAQSMRDRALDYLTGRYSSTSPLTHNRICGILN